MATIEQPNRIDEHLDKVESACIELTKGQAETNRRLDGIDTRLENLENTCVKLTRGQAETNRRLDGMDETLKIILERLS